MKSPPQQGRELSVSNLISKKIGRLCKGVLVYCPHLLSLNLLPEQGVAQPLQKMQMRLYWLQGLRLTVQCGSVGW
jgi:hypothetical protein